LRWHGQSTRLWRHFEEWIVKSLECWSMDVVLDPRGETLVALQLRQHFEAKTGEAETAPLSVYQVDWSLSLKGSRNSWFVSSRFWGFSFKLTLWKCWNSCDNIDRTGPEETSNYRDELRENPNDALWFLKLHSNCTFFLKDSKCTYIYFGLLPQHHMRHQHALDTLLPRPFPLQYYLFTVLVYCSHLQ
jgi:hypothetical protein